MSINREIQRIHKPTIGMSHSLGDTKLTIFTHQQQVFRKLKLKEIFLEIFKCLAINLPRDM